MELIQIYQCFCDLTRLRILQLLTRGPLCVCHFQSILEESQVKVSKHLSYLRERGLVEAERHQNWMIYRLPAKPPLELRKNLQCLQDCVQTEPVFKEDLRRWRGLRTELAQVEGLGACCPAPAVKEARK